MRKWILLILLLPTLGFGKETPTKKPRLSYRSTDQPSTFSEYSFTVGYRLATDLMEQSSSPTYFNSLNLGASVKFRDWFRILGGLDFSYVALGTSIPNEPDNPSLGDIYLGVSRNTDLSPTFSLVTDLINTFPTSERSRTEGYQSVLDFNVALRAKIYKDIYSITNALSLEHVFNTNEFSPTTEQYNPDWSLRYGLKNSVRLIKGLTLSFTINVKSTTFTDGTSLLTYGNSTSLAYELNRWVASLGYENGQDLPQREIDMWFINQYRKMVSLRVSYAF